MEKHYCEDCKWNSYNIEIKRHKKQNFLKKFFDLIFYDWKIELERKHPQCLNSNVFKVDDDLVFKKNSGKRIIFCSTARTESSYGFSTCGKEGKYFETND